jgi:sugar phosphate isomerase/epimerase
LFKVGLNPYGLSYTVGLQGLGTPRANPSPIGLDGFIEFARSLGSACVEVDWRWLAPLSDSDLARTRDALNGVVPIYSYWLAQQPGETLTDPIRRAQAIRASIFRMHLTPVLEGARASWGPRWQEMVAHARQTLKRDAHEAFDAGLILAIENHQDLGSEELLEIVEELGPQAGIVLDTGNPFAVGEDPVAFTRRAAHRIRHVHLKDYMAMFTPDGYLLVRCPIGEGAVPFDEIAGLLASKSPPLTASIEPGALEARHIRLFTSDWWNGYRPRDASELGVLLGRLRQMCLEEHSDCRTPWERMVAGDELVAYETAQILRSVENLRTMGWLD